MWPRRKTVRLNQMPDDKFATIRRLSDDDLHLLMEGTKPHVASYIAAKREVEWRQDRTHILLQAATCDLDFGTRRGQPRCHLQMTLDDRYQTFRSVSDDHVFVVCRDGTFYEIVPDDVRKQGPWQGQHRGEVERLNPEYRLALARDGYALVSARPLCSSRKCDPG